MSSQTAQHALYLAFNFASAVGIVLVNKACFSSMKFSFTTMLTAVCVFVAYASVAFCSASR